MNESPPAPAPTVAYPWLGELAALCRRQGCLKTADLIEQTAAMLAERFGADRPVTPPRATAVRMYLDRLEWNRVQAGQRADRVGALVAVCAISSITRALARGFDYSVGECAALTEIGRAVVQDAIERINASRVSEAAVARMTTQNSVKFRARQEQQAQEREALAAQARLAVARAQAAGCDV